MKPKSTVIESADAICARYGAKVPRGVRGPESFVRESVKLTRSEVTDLKAAGRPDVDEDKYDAFLAALTKQADDFERVAPDIAQNPTLLSNPDGEVIKDINAASDAAKAFGLKNCSPGLGAGSGSSMPPTSR